MSGLFSLKEGVVITVPENAVKEDSKGKRKRFDPKTPKVLRLKEKGGLFEVRTVNDDPQFREAFPMCQTSGYSGKVLFIPANVQPGDQLRIEWVDPSCACATFAN
jgi:hypothetical protein